MSFIGFHASHEQLPPSRLLEAVVQAEAAGFDGAMCSDHLAPWSVAQGESGFAWSWLGAALASTSFSLGVVTAPGQRYHPVITAQAIATLEEMYPGRFWAALGSGEAMNEHVTGDPWPPKPERNARLEASVDTIRRVGIFLKCPLRGSNVHAVSIWTFRLGGDFAVEGQHSRPPARDRPSSGIRTRSIASAQRVSTRDIVFVMDLNLVVVCLSGISLATSLWALIYARLSARAAREVALVEQTRLLRETEDRNAADLVLFEAPARDVIQVSNRGRHTASEIRLEYPGLRFQTLVEDDDAGLSAAPGEVLELLPLIDWDHPRNQPMRDHREGGRMGVPPFPLHLSWTDGTGSHRERRRVQRRHDQL